MRWAYQKYRVWVINTPLAAKLYLWDNWKRLMPGIGRLLELTPHQGHIRTEQSYEGTNRWLGFGRMKWNEEHNLLWTTKYRDGTEKEAALEFFDTEIWAPDWNTHVKTDIPPEIYIQSYHWADVPDICEGLIIAMPQRLYKKNIVLADEVISSLNAEIAQSTVSTVKRYWKPMWKIGNDIQAMNPQELFALVKGGK